ncbi:TIGR00730 family Rossman fold protein [Massilia sp. PAMC28688]|uniref:LOG family protein n=1 Tax=Massilia sp. PAMC28688 TaxID=2861283 RepID=UPI001C62C7EF|nr:TIGR00730 family Rossman fold protein [Massilia sp. PAMC28688]QYF93783.1 TIGR00730 family Rossman fold protein [Massilia sp. PAMC28688]
MKSIAVYCGANPGTDPVYAAAARALGRLLAQRGMTVVYGGGHVGLMGVIADAALAAGGRVIGVIPQQLVDRELAHAGLTELFVVRNMHERKAMMAELADGFVAMPGGMGTLEELFEMLTWSQLEIHAKPIGVLNVAGFYDQLAQFIAHAASEGFIRAQHRDLMMVESDPEALLARLLASR